MLSLRIYRRIAPRANDLYGCTISEELSWDLFESTHVIGIHDGTNEYFVRGVFQGKRNTAIVATLWLMWELFKKIRSFSSIRRCMVLFLFGVLIAASIPYGLAFIPD